MIEFPLLVYKTSRIAANGIQNIHFTFYTRENDKKLPEPTDGNRTHKLSHTKGTLRLFSFGGNLKKLQGRDDGIRTRDLPRDRRAL